MTVTILVATPHAPFGELLRMSLEDSGQYSVRLVLSAREARAAAGHIPFQLAILDSALTDEPFVPLCKDLLNSQAGLRLVIIPPENNPNHPTLGDLLPHGYLSRPFYLPDLISTVSRLLNERQTELRQSGDLPAAAALSVTLPPWLQEPLILSNYLEKELAGTQALAGMIGMVSIQPGKGQLRAAAGKLTNEAAEELSGVVFRYWKCDEKTDLMRFIRLSADKRDYLVYATAITGDLVLILAYDTGAPLSLIRPQTKDMAQTLASLPPDGYHLAHPTEAAEAETGGMESTGLPALNTSAVEAPVASSPSESVEPPAAEAPAGEAAAPAEPQGPLAGDLPEIETGSADYAPAQETPVPEAPAASENVPWIENEPGLEEMEQGAAPARSEKEQTQPLRDSSFDSQPRSMLYPVEPPDLFEDEPGPELDVINLAAMLGAIPSPDPDGFTPNKNGWQSNHGSGRASDAIPTLPGGMNGWEHNQESDTGELPQAPARRAVDEVETDEEFLSLLRLPSDERQPAAPEENPSPVTSDSDKQEVAGQEVAGQEVPGQEQPRSRILGTRPLEMPAEPDQPESDSPAADWAYAWGVDSSEQEMAPQEVAAPHDVAAQEAASQASAQQEIKTQQDMTQGVAASDHEPVKQEPSSVWSAEVPAWPVEEPARKEDAPTSGYSLTARTPDLPDEPAPDPLEDTRPRVIATIAQLDQLEPVSPALSLLNYTCVLVPRMPNHYLIGDLADRLSAWVAQICLAFGWRLEGIAVRPEYLQWSVQVAPAISPGNLVRILRQRTSLNIFNAFQNFAEENPSGDFWATGYLIVSGPQPPSAQLLRDYIVQTRKRQGVIK